MAENNPEKPKNKYKNLFPGWFYLTAFFVLIGLFFYHGEKGNAQPSTWNEFNQKMLQTHSVEKISIVNNDEVWVYIKKDKLKEKAFDEVSKGIFGATNPGPHYFFSIGSVDIFIKQLDAAQSNFLENEKIEVDYSKKSSPWGDILSWGIPVVFFLFMLYLLSGRVMSSTGGIGGSVFNFGKSKAVLFDKGNIKNINFKNVAGYEEAKIEIMEVVEFLKNPSRFTRLGAKIPKGILLVGPSGTGKTLMAKAVAGEAEVPFFSLSGSEFVEMFVGIGASRVRDLFTQAKEKAPCIVFIDEIDTVGRMRGKAVSFQVNDERESTLNQLLAEMDGFSSDTGVIVLAATNRADILDAALVRPGRFDRHIYLELPNKNEREAIFKIHLSPLKHDKAIDIPFLASQTPGFSGADIANVCNEAALIAARSQKDEINMDDFYNAIDKMVAGLEKKTKIITPSEKKIISMHEAGHALVSWMLKNVDPLVKVSIIPRGKSLGSAWYLPEEKQILTQSQLFDRLCVMLGGRASEDFMLKEISSGALDDLEKATKQAYAMVADLGLSDKLPNISFYDSTGMSDSLLQKPYSEETSAKIDKEVLALIGKAYDKAIAILAENKTALQELAKQLLEKEVLHKEDLEKILGKRKTDEVSLQEPQLQ